MAALRVAFFVAAAALASVPAVAGERAIEIGEVSSQVAPRAGVDYAGLVRRASEDEIRALDLTRVPHGKRVIVSVALVRMDTDAPRTSATCVVHATIRDAKRGSMLATLEGRARADGERHSVGTVEETALQGALHGALAGIPDVLRR